MGAIIAAGIGAAGSLIGGMSSNSAAKKAAQQSLTGYNYLTNPNTGVTGEIKNGTASNDATAELLGTKPVTPGTQTAFDNYLNSTGHAFTLDQGTRAIAGSASSRGLLNSGATAKALTSYGQGLASQHFDNYLNQLNTQTNQGLTASGQVGGAGTTGGGNAGAATAAGGAAMGNGIATAAGAIGGGIGNNLPTIKNFFSGI